MSEAIITVEGLGKKYRISHQGGRPRYTALRDVITEKAKGLFKKLKSGNSENLKSGNDVSISASQHVSVSKTEDFWALKDVSFEVKRGEVIGIIGRNGAGKSTLLKILSRITEPTTGEVRLRGRVASLLEVGTGFHPELTGRENVYLNGAILGMHRSEIKRKFDEIVAFAEVEKFLDTPVKRYSSGMYVRLAFAVAAHLEPEILIVDEVLAVGDSEFQTKCLGKMKDVSTSGRTVLFVSHNLTAIGNLCSKGVLLRQGQVIMVGDVQTVCAAYADSWKGARAYRKSTGILRGVSLIDAAGAERNAVMEGDRLRFLCEVQAPQEKCLVSLIVRDGSNAPLFELFDNFFSPPLRGEDPIKVTVETEPSALLPGHYSVDFWMGDRMSNGIENVHSALEFDIVAAGKSDTSLTLNGSLRCESEWRIL
jgi:lipopolysaccharide transport system ATP-binding protein